MLLIYGNRERLADIDNMQGIILQDVSILLLSSCANLKNDFDTHMKNYDTVRFFYLPVLLFFKPIIQNLLAVLYVPI